MLNSGCKVSDYFLKNAPPTIAVGILTNFMSSVRGVNEKQN